MIRTGSYYNPAAPGWGVLVTPAQGGNAIVVGVYYHEDGGRAKWLVGSGPADSHTFDLFETTCIGFPSIAPVTTRFGTINFVASDFGTQYEVTIADERLQVSPPPPQWKAQMVLL